MLTKPTNEINVFYAFANNIPNAQPNRLVSMEKFVWYF